jgi:DNA-binding MarR family transcriptional regulator
MTTTQTSRAAYKMLNLTEQQEAILELMRRDVTRDWCIADAAGALGWDKSTVSGRMNGLKNLGLIEFTTKKPSISTGITSEHFRMKLQEQLF